MEAGRRRIHHSGCDEMGLGLAASSAGAVAAGTAGAAGFEAAAGATGAVDPVDAADAASFAFTGAGESGESGERGERGESGDAMRAVRAAAGCIGASALGGDRRPPANGRAGPAARFGGVARLGTDGGLSVEPPNRELAGADSPSPSSSEQLSRSSMVQFCLAPAPRTSSSEDIAAAADDAGAEAAGAAAGGAPSSLLSCRSPSERRSSNSSIDFRDRSHRGHRVLAGVPTYLPELSVSRLIQRVLRTGGAHHEGGMG